VDASEKSSILLTPEDQFKWRMLIAYRKVQDNAMILIRLTVN